MNMKFHLLAKTVRENVRISLKYGVHIEDKGQAIKDIFIFFLKKKLLPVGANTFITQ